MPNSELSVAIGGLGAIGMVLARTIAGDCPDLRLAAVSANDKNAARQRLANAAIDVPVLDLAELAVIADVVVECAPAKVFRDVAVPTIEQGRIFMPLGVGQLLVHEDLIARARQTGARIMPPTGALLGLDAVRAAAEGTIESASIITRKHPRGFEGAPYILDNKIDLQAINEPTRIFKGSAREGAKGFPANVNVAAALSLAGFGADRTILEIWADPTVERNIHTIKVRADSANLEMKIENVPSEDNPRTGKITALSTIAALKALNSTLKIGS